MPRGRLSLTVCGLLLAALLLVPAAAIADDVNDEVRSAYDLAHKMLRKGDRASLEKAFSALDTRKDEALDSVDYWTLFARVWKALEKSDSELWDTVVKQRQDAAPKSPVFCLARAQMQEDGEERGKFIEAALARNPRSIRARTAKAVYLLDQDEEDAGWELLEAVVEDDPYAEGALYALARLALSDGLPEEAVEHLDKALEKHQSARLHHLKAMAYQRWAKNDADKLPAALDAAAQALGMDPSDEHIKLYNELLKQTGDAATAAKALKIHFERTKLPMLGALLAESAFRAGDYEGTIMGLEASTGNDLSRLKGLAVAYARLGRRAEAQRAATKVKQVDAQGVLFAAAIDLHVGDADGVKSRLGALADEESKALRAQAHAWAGEVGALESLVAKDAASGTRAGEDALIALLQARLIQKMGGEFASAVRKKLIEARFAAGRKIVSQARVEDTDLGEAKTAGWPVRAVTYMRSSCGKMWRPPTDGARASTTFFFSSGDSKPSVAQGIGAVSDCAEDKERTFHFNKKESKTRNGMFELFTNQEKLADFEPAETAFAAGCAACVAGDADKATAAFTKALKVEPNWHRAKVFRAVMQALGPNAEKRDASTDAGKALAAWPDDFEARRMVVFLRAWAGDVGIQGEIDALAEREAQYNERDLNAL